MGSEAEAFCQPDPATWEGDYIAANGTVFADGSRFLYWYQGGALPRIGLAVSSDGGATWTSTAIRC